MAPRKKKTETQKLDVDDDEGVGVSRQFSNVIRLKAPRKPYIELGSLRVRLENITPKTEYSGRVGLCKTGSSTLLVCPIIAKTDDFEPFTFDGSEVSISYLNYSSTNLLNYIMEGLLVGIFVIHATASARDWNLIIRVALTPKAYNYSDGDGFLESDPNRYDQYTGHLISCFIGAIEEKKVIEERKAREEEKGRQHYGYSRHESRVDDLCRDLYNKRSYCSLYNLTSFIRLGTENSSYFDRTKCAYNEDGFVEAAGNEFDLVHTLDAIQPSESRPQLETPVGLVTPLLRFQKQALAWMMERETNTRIGITPFERDTGTVPEGEEKSLEDLLNQIKSGKCSKTIVTPHDNDDEIGKKRKRVDDQASDLFEGGSDRPISFKANHSTSSPVAYTPASQRPLHPLWRHLVCDDGTEFYMCCVTGTVSRTRFAAPAGEPGGILAEEMGLGKTLEMLALILSHPRDLDGRDPSRSAVLMKERALKRALVAKAVKATLIVTPETLSRQWQEEIGRHAPDLSVFMWTEQVNTQIYNDITEKYKRMKVGDEIVEDSDGEVVQTTKRKGRKSARLGGRTTISTKTQIEKEARALIQQQIETSDIVLTTFGWLRQEMKDKKSCLLTVQWWRIVLDEAQMICNSNSDAALMAAEMWRVNSWCVTGTPVNNGLHDLHGLLVFLDHDPFASEDMLQLQVLQPFNVRSQHGKRRMRGFLASIMWRHAKKHVQDQLNLPKLSKETCIIELGGMERTFYNALHRRTQNQIVNELHNNPWRRLAMNKEIMALITELRQACSHPQIVRRAEGFLGPTRQRKTMAEIMTLLYEDSRKRVKLAETEVNREKRARDSEVSEIRRETAALQAQLDAMLRSDKKVHQDIADAEERERTVLQNKTVLIARLERVVNQCKSEATYVSAKSGELGVVITGRNKGTRASKMADDDEDVEVVVASEEVAKVDECCPICMEDMENVIMTPCAHSFCSGCVEIVMPDGNSGRCPVCRSELRVNQLMEVLKEVKTDKPDVRFSHLCVGDFGSKVATLVGRVKGLLAGFTPVSVASSPPASPSLSITRRRSFAPRADTFKCVVFSQWPSMLELVRDAFSANGITSASFFGSDSSRTTALEAFTEDPSCTALLVSMTSGSTSGAAGLNLTIATHAFLLEPSLNPGLEDQAVNRIYRIGQNRPTTVVRFMTPTSIEDRILQMQERKRALRDRRAEVEMRMEVGLQEADNANFLSNVEESILHEEILTAFSISEEDIRRGEMLIH